MMTDSQWTSAGKEPRLSDILSDPATRHLMLADGVSTDEVNAIIERIRHRVPPMAFATPKRVRSGGSVSQPSKFLRSVKPIEDDDNMQAASGVVSRWIASLMSDKTAGLD